MAQPSYFTQIARQPPDGIAPLQPPRLTAPRPEAGEIPGVNRPDSPESDFAPVAEVNASVPRTFSAPLLTSPFALNAAPNADSATESRADVPLPPPMSPSAPRMTFTPGVLSPDREMAKAAANEPLHSPAGMPLPSEVFLSLPIAPAMPPQTSRLAFLETTITPASLQSAADDARSHADPSRVRNTPIGSAPTLRPARINADRNAPTLLPPARAPVPESSVPEPSASSDDAPHIRIGTVEIRISQPAAPPLPAPVMPHSAVSTSNGRSSARDTDRLARGFAHHFGLRQG